MLANIDDWREQRRSRFPLVDRRMCPPPILHETCFAIVSRVPHTKEMMPNAPNTIPAPLRRKPLTQPSASIQNLRGAPVILKNNAGGSKESISDNHKLQ
jgi:hypothetical protein